MVGTINDARYQGSASRVLVIAPMAQTISFFSPGDRFIDEAIDLSATGGASGNPVTFRVLDGPAVVDGSGRLTFTGAGLVTIAAEQAGGSNIQRLPPSNIVSRFTYRSRMSRSVRHVAPSEESD